MAVKREEELYEPIKQHFEEQGYDVKSEVLNCDLVAVHQDTGAMVIVEMKKTFNLALLLQGVERLRLNGDVFLAVERNRKKSGAHNQRFGDLAELCRMLGIGLMTVTFYKTKAPVLDVLCEPGDPPVRGNRVKKRSRLLMEFKERSGDYNTGGSTGRMLMTAYREKALRCAYTIDRLGPCSPSRIAKETGYRRCGDMLRHNYYGWFHRIERGKYGLLPSGADALKQYSHVIEEWASSFNAEP
ncbi:DUF2161 family putative PD-(D/E)XK-type phosphodiesterase [Paenibacillus sp. J5C_2022]|uniref:DUF2161 domain-containing phosphodiesterase n=1 Tax=Paenibacillus sp. J5C2022 TaxID=2977129 RepID=UPI0021D0FF78|nr:DUF2161 family putative PD-(D/E)XK-type phosphodiesterase [Paenibacillus sp. J5C2022]MCU6709884.1 DUF2161 family putative PD-(D/E)XK-type phosphodiesterase [Paenibacillus sp. J5C2022]